MQALVSLHRRIESLGRVRARFRSACSESVFLCWQFAFHNDDGEGICLSLLVCLGSRYVKSVSRRWLIDRRCLILLYPSFLVPRRLA